MEPNDNIQLFENRRIRTAWDEEKEEWYFSIVDVVAVLTDQPDQRGASNYWAKLKQRLKEEGANQLLTNCQQLKMKSPKDGKRYNTDVADTEQLLRIIQSIPSPKAEPLSKSFCTQLQKLLFLDIFCNMQQIYFPLFHPLFLLTSNGIMLRLGAWQMSAGKGVYKYEQTP